MNGPSPDGRDGAPLGAFTWSTLGRALLPFALGYFISYLLRGINQVIAPDLIREFDLNQSDLGRLTSAYLFAFVLFQIPLGILLDRFGPRKVQLGLLSVAGVGVAFFAVADSVWQLTLARGVIGLGLSGSLMACFKANALWFPLSRVALANSTAVALGALGLVVATEPADWLARQIGWRNVFWLLVIAIGAVVALIFALAPRGGGVHATHGLTAQISAQRGIFQDKQFWRIAPMVAAISGSYIAIQSLWAGRWIADANGWSREDGAHVLLWMALAFVVGSLSTGILADRLQRRGIPLKAVIAAGFSIFVLSQILIITRLPISPYVCWVMFGFSGQAANLAYATLAEHFGRALAGRAQSAANLVLFLSATAFQWGIGVILDFFPGEVAGSADPHGYQVAFGTVLAVQALAFAWYLMGDKPTKAGTDRPLA